MQIKLNFVTPVDAVVTDKAINHFVVNEIFFYSLQLCVKQSAFREIFDGSTYEIFNATSRVTAMGEGIETLYKSQFGTLLSV